MAAAVAVAVIATVVVVVVNAGDSEGLGVATRSRTETRDGVRLSAEYVAVSGYRDPRAEKVINAGLMAPIDRRFALATSVGREHTELGTPGSTTTAKVVLRTDQILSVRYDHHGDDQILAHPTWYFSDVVDIDLAHGRVLGPREMFRPEAFSSDGLSRLVDVLFANAADKLCRPRAEFKPLTADNFDPANDFYGIQFAATDHGMEVLLNQPALGYETACGQADFTVPYADLADLLAPDVLPLLPGAPQAPQATTTTTATAQALSVGVMTLPAPASWTVSTNGAESLVDTGDATLVVSDNKVTSADQPAYVAGAPYSRTTSGRTCAAVGKPDVRQSGDGELRTRDTRIIGDESALYEQWRIDCDGTDLTQRLWYLPRLQLVIVDEWGIPGLDDVLAKATFH